MSEAINDGDLSDAERAIDVLLEGAHRSAQHELPPLIAQSALLLGATDAVVYLADIQQLNLLPFLDETHAEMTRVVEPLGVDSTMAGRAFQHIEVLVQATDGDQANVWLPLLDGAERLGVLMVTLPSPVDPDDMDGVLGRRLRRLAALAAGLLTTKTAYGDTVVRLRRRAEMGLAAELQWSLLPPLNFATPEITVAGALEPAYHIAGDSLDYAVDATHVRAVVLDGMGHGLRSAQLAAIAVAAHRNARRSGLGLPDTAAAIHEGLTEAFGGNVFTTGVLAEIDTHSGMFSWVNAGHPAPLLLRGNKHVKTLSCQPALPFGLAIAGHETQHRFGVCYEQLEPEDLVLLYSDGVTEARAPNGQFFGDQRLADLLSRYLADGLPAPETMRRVVRDLLDHHQSQLSDDATLLLLEWRRPRMPLS